MTWIKPSFNWMMYRSGYAEKPGQEMVLAIDISREGFEWALENAVLSSFNPLIHSTHEAWQKSIATAPVRVQWDPERDWQLQPIKDVRAIQIGLQGTAIQRYVNDWIVAIEDMTPVARRLSGALRSGTIPDNLPHAMEKTYPLAPELKLRLSRTILPDSE